MIENPLLRETIYVVDTSYLIDLFLRMLWTLRLENLMRRENTPSVIPIEVTREFLDIFQVLRNSPYEISTKGGELEKVLRANTAPIYPVYPESVPFAEETANGKSHDPKPLTITDKTFVEEAVTLARKGKSVYAATGDFGIVRTLEEVRDRENLELMIVSPKNIITKDDFGSLGLRIVMTSSVFDDLFGLDPNGNDRRYVAVAKNMDLGFGVSCDIAFGIYTKREMFKPLPAIDGVYFLPLAIADIENEKVNVDAYYLSFARFREVIAYRAASPGFIYIIQQNPIPPEYLQKLMTSFKKRGLTELEAGNMISRLNIRGLNWARVENQHLKRLNKATLGVVNDLRNGLQHK